MTDEFSWEVLVAKIRASERDRILEVLDALRVTAERLTKGQKEETDAWAEGYAVGTVDGHVRALRAQNLKAPPAPLDDIPVGALVSFGVDDESRRGVMRGLAYLSDDGPVYRIRDEGGEFFWVLAQHVSIRERGK